MMTPHSCFVPDAPNGRINCVCVRGIDHSEADFDIPLEDDEVDAAIEAALNDPGSQPYVHSQGRYQVAQESFGPSVWVDTSKRTEDPA